MITLKDARKQAGITAVQAAEILDCSRSQIYRWESGKATLPYWVRDKLFPLYGVEEKDVIIPKDYAISREKMMQVEAALYCAYGFPQRDE